MVLKATGLWALSMGLRVLGLPGVVCWCVFMFSSLKEKI